MGRKSIIGKVKAFLEEAKNKALEKMYEEINTKNFLWAEIHNRVIEDILNPAITLCGEAKSMEEGKDGTEINQKRSTKDTA